MLLGLPPFYACPHHAAAAYRLQLVQLTLTQGALKSLSKVCALLSDSNGEFFSARIGVTAQRGERGRMFAAAQ